MAMVTISYVGLPTVRVSSFIRLLMKGYGGHVRGGGRYLQTCISIAHRGVSLDVQLHPVGPSPVDAASMRHVREFCFTDVAEEQLACSQVLVFAFNATNIGVMVHSEFLRAISELIEDLKDSPTPVVLLFDEPDGDGDSYVDACEDLIKIMRQGNVLAHRASTMTAQGSLIAALDAVENNPE